MDVLFPQIISDCIHDSSLRSFRYVPREPWSNIEFDIQLCEQDELGEWSFAPIIVTARNVVHASFKMIGLDGGEIYDWDEEIPAELRSSVEESLRVAARRRLPALAAPLRSANLTLGDGSTISFICESLWVRRA